MQRVERGNVVLKVEDFEVQHYLTLGYSLTDDKGNVIKEAMPSNVGVLQEAYIKHTKKIAELEATIAELTAKLATTQKKAPKKADKE